MTVSSFEGSKTFKRQSMGHVAQFRINDRLLGSEFALFTPFFNSTHTHDTQLYFYDEMQLNSIL